MVHFADHPEFRPNLTPHQIFMVGVFSGTYFRDIYSSVNNKKYIGSKVAAKYACLKDVPRDRMCRNKGDVQMNKHRVDVGMSLDYWESHGWIHPSRPYGWLEWYCGFYDGKRTSDDARQIKRWQGIAGEKGRFRRRLINEIRHKRGKYSDASILPKIRQILITWGYQLTKRDYEQN